MLFDRIDYIDIVINEIQNHLTIFRIVKIIHAIVILAARTFGYREPERERQRFANTAPTIWRKRGRNCPV